MGNIRYSENSIKTVNICFKVTIIYKSVKCTIILWFLVRISYIPREQWFAHGTDLNFYCRQKNVNAKIENKIFSTVDELDTLRTINSDVFKPKPDSQCGSYQVFRKHFITMAHRADKEKLKK